jgi:hypothetical protein
LHDAVLRPRSSGDLILPVGQAEENHGRNSQRVNFPSFFYRFIHRKIEDARHRSNFLPHTFARANEHGIDERVGSEMSLAYQVAKLLSAAKPTKTGERKSHEIPIF